MLINVIISSYSISILILPHLARPFMLCLNLMLPPAFTTTIAVPPDSLPPPLPRSAQHFYIRRKIPWFSSKVGDARFDPGLDRTPDL